MPVTHQWQSENGGGTSMGASEWFAARSQACMEGAHKSCFNADTCPCSCHGELAEEDEGD